jgi:hypothetical protein
MQLEWKSVAFREVKASADGGQFEGLAAAFFNVDRSYWPDIIAPGAFAADLAEFLAEGSSPASTTTGASRSASPSMPRKCGTGSR